MLYWLQKGQGRALVEMKRLLSLALLPVLLLSLAGCRSHPAEPVSEPSSEGSQTVNMEWYINFILFPD